MTEQPDEPAKFRCTKCEREFTIEEAGYIGPRDRGDESCSPTQDFEYVCETCEGSNAYS